MSSNEILSGESVYTQIILLQEQFDKSLQCLPFSQQIVWLNIRQWNVR